MKRKKAVMTDDSHGIDRGIVYCLAEAGCDVIFPYDTDFDSIQHMLEALTGWYPDGVFDYYQAKLIEQGAAVSFFRQAVERLGGLDLMVNSVGITKLGSILSLTEETMDYLINLMLRTYVLVMRGVATYIANRGTRGNIINVSSARGPSAHPGDAIYGSIEAALNRIVQSVAPDVAPYGIRTNNILPGATKRFTPEGEAKTDPAHLGRMAYLSQRVPLEHYGTSEDVESLVVSLALNRAPYITGQSIAIDDDLSLPGLTETAAETAASNWGRVKKETRW